MVFQAAALLDDPNYSVALRQSFELEEDVFNQWLGDVVTAIHEKEQIRDRADTREVTLKALRVILGNLYRAYLRDPNLYVALPLHGNGYRQGMFNPIGVSYRGVRRVIDYLREFDPPLVSYRPGGHFPEQNRGFVTRVRASRVLFNKINQFIEGTFGPEDPTYLITSDTSSGATSSVLSLNLFNQHPLPIIRLRDERKNLKEFDDTPEVVAMREALDRWNEFQSLHWFDLCLPNEEFGQVVNGQYEGVDDVDEFGQNEEDQTRQIDIVFQRTLYRVFNNSSFDQGGRLYGGWWQHIPQKYRRYITINWAPTKELDFSNMQAAMLYAREGLPLEEDAYAIDGIDPQRYRKLIKLTFFKLINAQGRIGAPRLNELPEGWTWQQLQDDLIAKHAPIARYLNTGIGIELQRIDSDIAMTVLQRLQERNILALPVHDSFITYVGSESVLREMMAEAYRECMEANIGIDVDPSFLEIEYPIEEYGDPDMGEYDMEEIIYGIEQREEYSGYLQRKVDFLSTKDDAWKWRFTAG